MNIPNLLTLLRFLIIPVFGYFLYIQSYYIAFYLFLFGGLTDILDGYIARKFNLITSFGKLADPLADKLMQITALILLTMQQRIPSEILIIVLAKEVFMGVGSILLYKREHFVVSANWYGKLATVVFFLAIILTLFDVKYGSVDISKIAIAIALVSNLFAFFMYSITYRKIRNIPR